MSTNKILDKALKKQLYPLNTFSDLLEPHFTTLFFQCKNSATNTFSTHIHMYPFSHTFTEEEKNLNNEQQQQQTSNLNLYAAA